MWSLVPLLFSYMHSTLKPRSNRKWHSFLPFELYAKAAKGYPRNWAPQIQGRIAGTSPKEFLYWTCKCTDTQESIRGVMRIQLYNTLSKRMCCSFNRVI